MKLIIYFIFDVRDSIFSTLVENIYSCIQKEDYKAGGIEREISDVIKMY